MKRTFNLQLFAAEAVKGSKIVYLYRIMKEASKTDAVVMAFTTENTITISKDADTTATKDGSIRTPGESEIEITATSILSKGDTMFDGLKKAMLDDELIEIWEVNLAEQASAGTNKFKGTYYQGYLTEFEKTSSAEEYVECSTTFAVNGKGADGEVTVTTEQQAVADYVFRDTAKTGV